MLGALAAGSRACGQGAELRRKVDEGSFRLVRELQAPGVLYMRETLRLDADDPLIRLRAEIELLPDPVPQSVYYGFFARAQCGMGTAFDSAGIAIKLDEDQLPGSCRNWVTAGKLCSHVG